jgi:probable F420-dependent oxidoreductase
MKAHDEVGFGIQLPIQAQSNLFAQEWEADAGVAELTAVARAADLAGFGYVAVCDHVAIPKNRAETMGTIWWDTVATLAYVAAVTEQTRLVSHVVALPYRHPLMTAKQWLTLDAISGGRAVLGVGAGHVEEEFEALDLDFQRRGALVDEAIDAVRAAFASEFSSHDGPEWTYEDMGVSPRPVQDRIPIWIGGSSPAAIRRAAQRGDGWLPQGPPKEGMKAGIARLHELREVAGRADQAFVIGGLSGPLYVGEPGWDAGRAVSGEPAQVAAFLRGLAELGVTQIQVSFASRDHHELIDQLLAEKNFARNWSRYWRDAVGVPRNPILCGHPHVRSIDSWGPLSCVVFLSAAGAYQR